MHYLDDMHENEAIDKLGTQTDQKSSGSYARSPAHGDRCLSHLHRLASYKWMDSRPGNKETEDITRPLTGSQTFLQVESPHLTSRLMRGRRTVRPGEESQSDDQACEASDVRPKLRRRGGEAASSARSAARQDGAVPADVWGEGADVTRRRRAAPVHVAPWLPAPSRPLVCRRVLRCPVWYDCSTRPLAAAGWLTARLIGDREYVQRFRRSSVVCS